MIASDALASLPLASAGPDSDVTTLYFDIRRTIISQYANSPVITAILEALGDAIDRYRALDTFRSYVWEVATAKGFGLDILGRIVGVSRALYVSDEQYLGFSQSSDAAPFGQGVFYAAWRLTPNFNLSDEAYRRLILAKAALNITDCAIPSLNAILRALFPGYGNCYVRDNADMSLTYVFGAPLSKVDYAIVSQSGALPKPAGCAMTVEQP